MSVDRGREAVFLDQAKALLDRRAEELDGLTLERLRRARRAALAGPPRSTRALGRLVWAGGLATAAVALVAGSLWLLQPATHPPVGALEDLEILAASENLDFYEDLEFYRWLAESDGTNGSDATG